MPSPAVQHVASLRKRIQQLSHELYLEHARRQQAEANAKQLHAMLLRERIQRLPEKTQ